MSIPSFSFSLLPVLHQQPHTNSREGPRSVSPHEHFSLCRPSNALHLKWPQSPWDGTWLFFHSLSYPWPAWHWHSLSVVFGEHYVVNPGNTTHGWVKWRIQMGTLLSTGFCACLADTSRITALDTGIIPASSRSEKGTWSHLVHPLTGTNV